MASMSRKRFPQVTYHRYYIEHFFDVRKTVVHMVWTLPYGPYRQQVGSIIQRVFWKPNPETQKVHEELPEIVLGNSRFWIFSKGTG